MPPRPASAQPEMAPVQAVQAKGAGNWLMSAMSYGQQAVQHATVVVDATVGVAQLAIAQTDALVRASQVNSLTAEQVARVRELYNEGDVRHDGSLDKQELRHALYRLTGKWLSEAELNIFWAQIDADGSNTVSFEEFLAHAGPALFPPVTYQVMRAAAEQAQRVKQYGHDAVEDAALSATDPIVDLVIDRLHAMLVEDFVDIDMPHVIQTASKRVLSSAVDDLRVEVKEIAKHQISKLAPERPPPSYTNRVFHALKAVRARFLYTLFPYDKSVWLQLKDPLFYVLKALSVFPPPVQPVFFLVQFLLMDHWDECARAHLRRHACARARSDVGPCPRAARALRPSLLRAGTFSFGSFLSSSHRNSSQSGSSRPLWAPRSTSRRTASRSSSPSRSSHSRSLCCRC